MIRQLASPTPRSQAIAASLSDRARRAARALTARWPSAHVRLFGSVARGACHAHSDIDLVVYGLPAAEVLAAWQTAESAAGTESIDVLRYEECPPALREAIDEESVPM